jgi:hypothetical protein
LAPARRRSGMRAAPGLCPPRAVASPDGANRRRRNIRRLPNVVDNVKAASIRNKSLIRAQVSFIRKSAFPMVASETTALCQA